jgi:hypothetical protein
MASRLTHPERVVGFHFFNPVAVMPLLEVVRGGQTDEATLATAFATGKVLKKTRILVRHSPEGRPAPDPEVLALLEQPTRPGGPHAGAGARAGAVGPR